MPVVFDGSYFEVPALWAGRRDLVSGATGLQVRLRDFAGEGHGVSGSARVGVK